MSSSSTIEEPIAPGGAPLLGKDYWVATCTPVETATPDDIDAVLPTHLDWVRAIEERDQLLMAGPLLVGPGVRFGSGMIILRAANETEADAIAKEDPFVTAGLRTFVLHQWRLNAGSISVRLSLSRQTYDWL
jgi:uncharacterized protein YciI